MAKLVEAHTVSQLPIGKAKPQASSKEAQDAFDNMMGITKRSVIFGDGDTEVISKQKATVLRAAISHQN